MAPKLPVTPPSGTKPVLPLSTPSTSSSTSSGAPYLSSHRARSGTLISLAGSDSTPPHPPSRPAATLQLLNPSASPYTALTPPVDIPDPFNGAPAALGSGLIGGVSAGSAHTLRTLAHGSGGGGPYFDEYDEEEVDRFRSHRYLSRSSSASSLALPASGARSRAGSGAADHPIVRAVPAARPRSASTIIDITPQPSTSLTPPGSRPHVNRTRSSSGASITSVSSNFAGLQIGGRTSTLRHAGGLQGLLLERPLLRATVQTIGLMLACATVIGFLVWWMLPPVDDEDRSKVRIPTSFEQLQELNSVLQVYKTRHWGRVLGSYILIYLFLQTFSLPGSMYLSILAGAMYGVLFALPLVCLLVATGALLCFTLSSVLGGPFIHHSSRWRSKLDQWRNRLASRTTTSDLFSYLVVLRISPLPPHWVVNLLAPHLGIPRGVFFVSTFFGIAGISLIHVQIGTTLDKMTGPEDFELFSARNLLALAGIAVAVMVPVGIRWYMRGEISAVAAEDGEPGSRGARRSAEEEAAERVASSSRRPVKEGARPAPRPPVAVVVAESSEEETEEEDARSIIGHAEVESTDDEDVTDPLRGEGVRLLGSPIKVRTKTVRLPPDSKAARVLGVGRG